MTRPALGGAALWCGVIVLALIGIVAAAGRALHPADMTLRSEAIRPAILAALGLDDPFAARRPAEVKKIEVRYSDHLFAREFNK